MNTFMNFIERNKLLLTFIMGWSFGVATHSVDKAFAAPYSSAKVVSSSATATSSGNGGGWASSYSASGTKPTVSAGSYGTGTATGTGWSAGFPTVFIKSPVQTTNK